MVYDILIKNGKIVEGNGNPWYWGDVAVKEDKIVSVGLLKGVEAEEIIDAKGLVVVPGFIDAHSHSDSRTLVYREMESTIMQGITTVVAGQCGSTIAPIDPTTREQYEKKLNTGLPEGITLKVTWTTFDEYLKEEEKAGLGANVAHLVGHGAIRTAGMGQDARAPTAKELEKMKELTKEAMKAGAYGISSGLIYPPGIFAKTKELIELAKVAAEYGGIYDTHLRGEGCTLVKSVKEAITIGEKANVPVQISHHKAACKAVWGKSKTTLRLIEKAREKGIDITVDQYPYEAGATGLINLIPPWAHDGGRDKLLERLADTKQREKMRKDIKEGISGWENFAGELGWENVMVSSIKSDKNKKYEGKTMDVIAEEMKEKDAFDALWKLLLEEEGTPGMIIFCMEEGDIKRIMASPYQMVGTDSSSVCIRGPFSHGKPHPRHFGTYPRVLGKYVREENVLRFEEAIRKMTSFPAQRFGILDRGIIRPGMFADIVIIDQDKIMDKATFENPHQYPEGIPYVIVNGKITVDKGKYIKVLAGKTLRKR
ncbi:D-aminoacylase [Candidatus Bathyarchaeota archaeon]|nr:D-aminoacylase [Candidatus Bathyarchaeota archaeon]